MKRKKVQGPIQNLATELKAAIVYLITDLDTLKNLAFTDQGFYAIIKREEAQLCTKLFNEHIGHAFLGLGVAVANARALHKTRQRALYGTPRPALRLSVKDVTTFVDEHFPQNSSGTVADPHPKMTLKACLDAFAFHKLIGSYDPIFLKSLPLPAVSTPGSNYGRPRRARPRAPAGAPANAPCNQVFERDRFWKALYLMELLGNLFPRGRGSESDFEKREKDYMGAWKRLLINFAPWELQQARCAKELIALHVQTSEYIFIYLITRT